MGSNPSVERRPPERIGGTYAEQYPLGPLASRAQVNSHRNDLVCESLGFYRDGCNKLCEDQIPKFHLGCSFSKLYINTGTFTHHHFMVFVGQCMKWWPLAPRKKIRKALELNSGGVGNTATRHHPPTRLPLKLCANNTTCAHNLKTLTKLTPNENSTCIVSKSHDVAQKCYEMCT
jgi:hypothetical protein